MEYLLLLIILPLMVTHQTKNTFGDGTYSSNKVLYTIDGVKVRLGNGTYSSSKSCTPLTGIKVRREMVYIHPIKCC
jgi:hypothetical protein